MLVHFDNLLITLHPNPFLMFFLSNRIMSFMCLPSYPTMEYISQSPLHLNGVL